MAIDEHYIPAFSIEDVLLDKDTGAPLSGGVVTFEEALQPGILKPVWQITNTSGNYTYTQLPNPMILSSIGTFLDALDNPVVPYFLPFNASGDPEYYRVIVQSSGLVEQFVRDPVPYIPDDLIHPGGQSINFTNELSNPQFQDVLFDTVSASHVYTIAGASMDVIHLAPSWDLIVSGTGSVTVSQTRPVGSLNRPTNPGTLLNITSAGITFLRLRQRLYGSPNLFGSGFMNGFFVAKTFGMTSAALTMLYSQSNGTVVDQAIVTANLPGNGAYTEFSQPNPVIIPISDSADSFPNAYVDIDIVIPIGTNIEITSIQLVGTGVTSVATVPYDQESNDRQTDFEFHYFQPQINFKPIPSMLVGWDFPLNPAQILGSSVTLNTTPAYIWDQTIGTSIVGNVAVVRSGVTHGLQATTANADEAFYLMQYLDGAQARKILGTKLSVNVNAYRTQAGGAVTVRVYLYRGTFGATFPILPTPLGTIAASGVFTLTAANWALIPRGALGQAQGTLSVVDTAAYSTLNDVVDLSFNGWEIVTDGEIANTDKFAIVVTFQCPTSGTVVVANSISLVSGDIPTRPAPQTADQVLKECQYYFEKSWSVTTDVGTATQTGALSIPMPIYPPAGDTTASAHSVFAQTFSFRLKAQKRNSSGIPTFYSPATGTQGQAGVVVYNIGAPITGGDTVVTKWGATSESDETIQMITDSTSGAAIFVTGSFAGSGQNAVANFHYTIKDQLGVVP